MATDDPPAESEDQPADGESRGEQPQGDPEVMDEPPQQTQLQGEAAESTEIQSSGNVESVSTYTHEVGKFKYKIVPEISRTGTNWRVVVFLKGVQGPYFQSYTAVSDEQADRLGMSRKLQERVNGALEYANEEMQRPKELRTAKRDKRSLGELEDLMEGSE